MDDEQRPPRTGRFASPLSRRAFLQRAAFAGLVVPPAVAALGACASSSVALPGGNGGATASGGSTAPSGLTIASPENPVTWPISPDNPVIADGLTPEKGGVLKVYNYADYLAPSLVKAFIRKYEAYDIDVEVSTFNDTEEAITKIRAGDVAYDLYFPSYDQISKLVTASLIRPLNHSYITNIDNVWPSFQNPWYDQDWLYSVPYTVYTTGVGWNNEIIPDDIGALSNPYSSLWDTKYAGKTAVIDDFHTAMSMVILEMGGQDINTGDPAELAKLSQRMTELQEATSPKVTIAMYNELPLGQIGLSQMWSGDIVNAVYYLPKGKQPSILDYWFPSDGRGMVDNDLMVVLKGGQCPVLAHLFIEFMLDQQNALKNFGFIGYQPPQNAINPERLVEDGFVPANLKSATVLPEYFDVGYRLLELPPTVLAEWQRVWQKFKAGG